MGKNDNFRILKENKNMSINVILHIILTEYRHLITKGLFTNYGVYKDYCLLGLALGVNVKNKWKN